MNNASRFVFALLAASSSVTAETIFTGDARYEGRILRQNEKEILVQPKKGAAITIDREQATAIYDDEGNLIWSHPSIVKNDPTPEGKAKVEIPQTESGGPYRGLHIGVGGSFGGFWPSGLVSSFPLGTTPSYRYDFTITSNGAWYYMNDQAVTFSLGYARRIMPIDGISESGSTGNGSWALDYIDARIGHRSHSGIFFIEPGLLTAVSLARAALIVDTASGRYTNSSYGTPTYLALYLAIGAHFQITRQIFGFAAIRAEHGFTPAVTGEAPTATDITGKVLSTAPIRLIPFGVSVQVGATWRFEL